MKRVASVFFYVEFFNFLSMFSANRNWIKVIGPPVFASTLIVIKAQIFKVYFKAP